jgi:hypothetical protein
MSTHNLLLGCFNHFCTPSGNANPDEGDIKTTFAAGNYMNGMLTPPEQPLAAVATVTCTKGGLTSAWLEITTVGGALNKVELKEDGASIGSITPGVYHGQLYRNIEDITAWIATHTGWSRTDLAAITKLHSGYCYAAPYDATVFPYNQTNRTDLGGGVVRLDVLNKTGGLGTSIDWHWEIIKFPDSGSGQVFENVCVINNELNNITGGNTIKTAAETTTYDFWFDQNGISQLGDTQFDGGFGGDNSLCAGVSLAAKTTGGGWSLYPTTSATTKMVNFAGFVPANDISGNLPLTNSYVQALTSPPTGLNGGSNSGNVSALAPNPIAPVIFSDPFNGSGTGYSWLPQGGLLTNLVPKHEPWDGQGNVKSANDCAGWISKNAVAMQPVPSGYEVLAA